MKQAELEKMREECNYPHCGACKQDMGCPYYQLDTDQAPFGWTDEDIKELAQEDS